MQSSAILRRKVMKPLMEKRRRARINNCLSELKRFLVANDYSFLEKHTSGRSQRVEKADILEMTVRYLRDHHSAEGTKDKAASYETFQEGYRQCMVAICRYTATTMDQTLRDALVNHLQIYLSSSAVPPSEQEEQSSPWEFENDLRAHPSASSRTSSDLGYETCAPTDISDDSCSDCGEPPAGSPDDFSPGLCNVPEDYSLPKITQHEHVAASDTVWRPW